MPFTVEMNESTTFLYSPTCIRRLQEFSYSIVMIQFPWYKHVSMSRSTNRNREKEGQRRQTGVEKQKDRHRDTLFCFSGLTTFKVTFWERRKLPFVPSTPHEHIWKQKDGICWVASVFFQFVFSVGENRVVHSENQNTSHWEELHPQFVMVQSL